LAGYEAGYEDSFDLSLAGEVQKYRQKMAKADLTYADANAAWHRDGHSGNDPAADQVWHAAVDDGHVVTTGDGTIVAAYRADYVQLDQSRRQQMAKAGFDLAQYLATQSKSTSDSISAQQASFDDQVAAAYYVAGSTPTGLEGTLATLAKNYDVSFASGMATALTNLYNANTTQAWAPWADLAQQEAQAHVTYVDQALASVVYTNRQNLATADNTYNGALGLAGRTRWMAQVKAQANQALAAATSTLSATSANGTPSLVPTPDYLVSPSVDLGDVSAILAQYATPIYSAGYSWLSGVYLPSVFGVDQYGRFVVWNTEAFYTPYWPSTFVGYDNYGTSIWADTPGYVSGSSYYANTWWGEFDVQRGWGRLYGTEYDWAWDFGPPIVVYAGFTKRPGSGRGAGRASAPVVWDWRATSRLSPDGSGKIYLHIFQWPTDGKFAVTSAFKSQLVKAYLRCRPQDIGRRQRDG